ncbi:MarR family transcriptional regulator [Nonomuraea sp. NPDC000554]|uniref:MarR family winged helix-turn-helix transcriptional regulator n=1 Tax=Nonomuraea sp. NPDC000554 TaxID=3154259 RepID=UPI003323BDE7
MTPDPTPSAASGPRDSVAAELDSWIGQMSGADPTTEAARQRIGRVSRQFERLLAEVAAGHQLTVGDWTALSALQRSGPPYQRTPKQLAEELGVTAGTMSVRIDRLTQAGLVEPVPAADGRSRPVRLTDLGRQRWSRATRDRTTREHDLLADALNPHELDQLNHLLARLLTRLEIEYGPAPRHGQQR